MSDLITELVCLATDKKYTKMYRIYEGRSKETEGVNIRVPYGKKKGEGRKRSSMKTVIGFDIALVREEYFFLSRWWESCLLFCFDEG